MSGVPLPYEDESLLAGLRAGDEAAYELLVRAHSGRLLATARRILIVEEDARDAVQDAFCAAFRSIARFEGGSQLSTWLHRIVVNAALMKLRGRRRRPEASIDDLLPCFDETGHTLRPYVEWAPEAEQAAMSAETSRRVRAAIDRLPEAYRTVLVLRDIEELDTTDVAERLGVTPNAVKIRLHRARQALRTLLAPSFEATRPAPPPASAPPTTRPR